MIIKIQKNKSADNVVNKNIVDVMTMDGVLRDETSIIDPVILIEGDVSDVADCNYLAIPAFERNYFIRNIVSVRNNLFEIHAHVDVLSSWPSELRSQRAIISRNRNLYNTYLNDSQFKIYQNSIIKSVLFPNDFPRSGNCYILATNGSGSSPLQ